MNRIKVIREIIDNIKANLYLEIGVEYGISFLSINCEIKIGIDPLSLNKNIKTVLNNKVKYFEMTSDEFFNIHKDIFNKHKIDVAFIDGLHEYKQSLRDVENCLKYLNKNGVIVMHDCNPSSEIIATPVNLLENVKKLQEWTGAWTGDVWKTIAHLRSFRNDLNIFVLNCDWGLGVITKGKPEQMLDYQIKDIEKMSYQHLKKDREKILNLKEPEYFYEFLEKLNINEYE